MKHGSTPLAAYAPKITPLVPKVGAPTPVQVATPKILPLRTPEKKQGSVPFKPHKEEGWTHFAKTENASVDLREKVATIARPSIPTPRIETPRVSRPIHIETPPLPDIPKVPERPPVAISPVAFEHERTAMPTSYAPITESRPLSTIVHKRSESPSFFAVFTHIPRSLIVTTIIVVGGGLGVLTAVLVVQKTKNAPPEVSEAPIVAPSFLTVDEQIAFPLETDRAKFYTTLIELGAKNPTLVSQFYPTVSESGRTIPAESVRIMEALSWNAPGSFVRGLGTHTMFGSVGEPFIILQSTNFDVAFAGMLSWERTMSTDLAPLFGEPLVTMAFTDALTSNRSIRILKDASGKEHIVYGFVNKNLIVVTTSTEALSKVISRIKSK